MKAIESTVGSLQQIYVIILALAIAEAFMQFVAAPISDPPQANIYYERLLPLLSFLLLVVPFYHGMSRFFTDAYDPENMSQSYGGWLLFDCFVFTVEAGLFFVLARSMPRGFWLQFCSATILLFVIDIIWGAITWCCRTKVIGPWVIINLIAAPVLGVIRYIFRSNVSCLFVSSTFLVILTRTIADYWKCRHLYFPKVKSNI